MRFETLDGARGIAALAILLFHRPEWSGLGKFAEPAYLGVDLFFILSGFVVAYAYVPRIEQGESFADLVMLRLIRIYPLYAISIAIGLCSLLFGRFVSLLDFSSLKLLTTALFAVFMLPVPTQYFSVSTTSSINGPAWSVCLELLANLLFFLAYFQLSVRRVLVFVAIFAALLVLAARHYGTLHLGWSGENLWGGVVRVAFGVSVGTALFLLNSRGTPKQSNLLAIAALGAVAFVTFYRLPFPKFTDPFVVIFILPTLVWGLIKVQPTGLLAKVCEELGRFSYPVYILQMPIFYLVRYSIVWWYGVEPEVIAPWPWLISLALIIVVSYATAIYYDDPVRRWLSGRFFGRSFYRSTFTASRN